MMHCTLVLDSVFSLISRGLATASINNQVLMTGEEIVSASKSHRENQLLDVKGDGETNRPGK